MAFFTTAQLAQQLEAELIGDGAVQITGFAPAELAQAGHLTFAETHEYFAKAEQGGASAILVGLNVAASKKPLLRVKNPRVAYARALPLFFPETQYAAGIHPSAVVAKSAQVDPSAHIGPHCVIGEQVKIGARTALLGGNHVGDQAQIGEDSRLYPNVVVYPRSQIGSRVHIHASAVIGSDGFGYVLDGTQHRKVLQLGNVIIHDDVEIGSNASIDRGALGSTVIGRGTKIDNLVQVAHNVVIGESCIIVGQSGIAGSTKLGSYTVIAAQAGIAGHLQIGNQVTVGAQSGVMNDIPDGAKWLGSPACPDRDAKRQYIAIRRLPELLRKLSELEKKFGPLLDGDSKTLNPMPKTEFIDPIDSPNRRRLPPLLRRAWYGLNQAFRRRIAHLDLTPDQFTVLRTLLEGDARGMTQRELSRVMSSDPNTVASLLERMEKLGYLERLPHERDRRAHRIKLLAPGRKNYEAARAIAVALQAEVLADVPAAGREEFLTNLAHVADACRTAAELRLDWK